MKYLRQFLIGLSSYITAGRIIFTTQIWLTFSVPLLLSIGLYFGGDVLAEDLIDNLANREFKSTDALSASQYLLIGVQALAIYISKYMTKYLIIALLAPLLTGISTKVEFQLTGNKYPLNVAYYIEDVIRALTITARNIIMQILVMGVVYLITYIYSLPDEVNQAVYYLTSFYFYGFAFIDYANERRRLSVSESVKFTRRHGGAAFALGMVYGLLWYIPFAGVVVAPIFAVVAGTITLDKLVDLSTNPFAVKPGNTAPESYRHGDGPDDGSGNGSAGVEIEIEVE
jgi:CysZ protein